MWAVHPASCTSRPSCHRSTSSNCLCQSGVFFLLKLYFLEFLLSWKRIPLLLLHTLFNLQHDPVSTTGMPGEVIWNRKAIDTYLFLILISCTGQKRKRREKETNRMPMITLISTCLCGRLPTAARCINQQL